MKMQWSKVLATGAMSVALITAGAQTTVTSSSKTSRFTTTASSGTQAGTSSLVKDDLFEGTEIFAKGASDVTEVTMDPDTLGMVGGKSKGRASRMVLNVVRTYEYDKPGMYNVADVDTFRNKLNTGEWHCSMHTRSLKTGESTDMCRKRRTDDLVETAMIVVEPKELTFIHKIVKRSADGEDGDGEAFLGPMAGMNMPLMAMVGPEVFTPLHLDLGSMNLGSMDFDAMQIRMNAEMKAHQFLNSAEMKKRIAEVEKSLQDAQKQLQKDEKKPE